MTGFGSHPTSKLEKIWTQLRRDVIDYTEETDLNQATVGERVEEN